MRWRWLLLLLFVAAGRARGDAGAATRTRHKVEVAHGSGAKVDVQEFGAECVAVGETDASEDFVCAITLKDGVLGVSARHDGAGEDGVAGDEEAPHHAYAAHGSVADAFRETFRTEDTIVATFAFQRDAATHAYIPRSLSTLAASADPGASDTDDARDALAGLIQTHVRQVCAGGVPLARNQPHEPDLVGGVVANVQVTRDDNGETRRSFATRHLPPDHPFHDKGVDYRVESTYAPTNRTHHGGTTTNVHLVLPTVDGHPATSFELTVASRCVSSERLAAPTSATAVLAAWFDEIRERGQALPMDAVLPTRGAPHRWWHEADPIAAQVGHRKPSHVAEAERSNDAHDNDQTPNHGRALLGGGDKKRKLYFRSPSCRFSGSLRSLSLDAECRSALVTPVKIFGNAITFPVWAGGAIGKHPCGGGYIGFRYGLAAEWDGNFFTLLDRNKGKRFGRDKCADDTSVPDEAECAAIDQATSQAEASAASNAAQSLPPGFQGTPLTGGAASGVASGGGQPGTLFLPRDAPCAARGGQCLWTDNNVDGAPCDWAKTPSGEGNIVTNQCLHYTYRHYGTFTKQTGHAWWQGIENGLLSRSDTPVFGDAYGADPGGKEPDHYRCCVPIPQAPPDASPPPALSPPPPPPNADAEAKCDQAATATAMAEASENESEEEGDNVDKEKVRFGGGGGGIAGGWK